MIALLPSLTTANRLKRLLEKEDIFTHVIQAPSSLSKDGCGYALQFDKKHFARVAELIEELGSRSKGFYECDRGAYKIYEGDDL